MQRNNSPQARLGIFTVVPSGNANATTCSHTTTNNNDNDRYYNPSSSSLTSTHWITIDGRSVMTTVTSDPRVIDDWVREVMSRTYSRGLIIGLDCEWKPNFARGQNNRVGLLQLCAGSKCLVVQLLYINSSESLMRFLLNPAITFVGVGIEGDVEKLGEHHGIDVGHRRFDLAELAASRFNRAELRLQGLKGLAREILGLGLSKPSSITMSNWSAMYLTEQQIEYACIDAYVSFAIGMKLLRRRRR